MADEPALDDALRRIDLLVRTVMRLHSVIFGTHRDLIAADAADDGSRALLSESVAISLDQLPTIVAEVRDLAFDIEAARLFDSSTSDVSAPDVAQRMARVEAQLVVMVRRQNEIADALDARLDER